MAPGNLLWKYLDDTSLAKQPWQFFCFPLAWCFWSMVIALRLRFGGYYGPVDMDWPAMGGGLHLHIAHSNLRNVVRLFAPSRAV